MTRAKIRIREVGPREGIQTVPNLLSTEMKVELLNDLVASGVREINAVSLVNPKVLPQMADAEAVLESFGVHENVEVSALAPNRRALVRAFPLREKDLIHKIFLIHAMSDAVIRANGVGMSREENLSTVLELAALAQSGGLQTAVFVSAAFGCSVDGEIDPEDVITTVLEMGKESSLDEIIVSDSTGQGNPRQVAYIFSELAARGWGDRLLGLHLHDTRGAGLANAVAAIDSPIENLVLDTSFGGLGGDVPFIPEAAGNIATEDVVIMLDGMGIGTGIDAQGIIDAGRRFSLAADFPLNSKTPAVGPVRWQRKPVF